MSGPWRRIFLVTIFAVVLSANLSGYAKEKVYESVYEGVRMNDDADHRKEELDAEKMSDYDKYRRDRRDIINDNKAK